MGKAPPTPKKKKDKAVINQAAKLSPKKKEKKSATQIKKEKEAKILEKAEKQQQETEKLSKSRKEEDARVAKVVAKALSKTLQQISGTNFKKEDRSAEHVKNFEKPEKFIDIGIEMDLGKESENQVSLPLQTPSTESSKIPSVKTDLNAVPVAKSSPSTPTTTVTNNRPDDRSMVELYKFIKDSKDSSHATICKINDLEKAMLENIQDKHLLEKFELHWNLHFAKAYSCSDRMRKHELLHGIIEYGVEKDKRNGEKEHTWLEKFLSRLVGLNDKDVLWALREAENSVDRKRYLSYRELLSNYGFGLSEFEEPVGPDEVPFYTDRDLIMPGWLGLVFDCIHVIHWREMMVLGWKNFEDILHSFCAEIGMERTEYLYVGSLFFLKICNVINGLKAANAFAETDEEKRHRWKVIGDREKNGFGPKPDGPAWMKPLMHARYIQWKRQYEIWALNTRRSNPEAIIPPLNYSRVMGKQNFGFPSLCQPTMAMNQIYKHLWELEPPHYKYLKVLRELDAIDEINKVMRNVNGVGYVFQMSDNSAVSKMPQPNLTLDVCVYLSKHLETSLLPITNTPVTQTKLPALQLKDVEANNNSEVSQ